MGWLDFFRKKKEKETETEVREVSVGEADSFIKEELGKQERVVGEINEKLIKKTESFVLGLREQIGVLEGVDLEKKKEHERIKIITRENLVAYVGYLNKLIIDLEKINKETDNYFREASFILSGFDKTSRNSFEKATILVGVEIGKVRELIRDFYKSVDSAVKAGKDSIEKINLIKELEKMKKYLGEAKGVVESVRENISELEKGKNVSLDNKKEKEKELLLFRKSEEFRESVETRNKLMGESERLKMDANNLRDKIGLKLLLSKFHEIESKSKLIKSYRDNFLGTLESDEGLELVEMLDSSLKNELGKEIERMRDENLRLKKDSEMGEVERKEDSLKYMVKSLGLDADEIDRKIWDEKRKLKRFDKKKEEIDRDILQKSKIILDGVVVVG